MATGKMFLSHKFNFREYLREVSSPKLVLEKIEKMF